MRSFLALDLPNTTREALRELAREKIPGAKWVPEGQCHLTLRFLGELGEAEVAALRAQLEQVRGATFSLTPHGVGVFPDARRPRVLWVGLAAPPELFTLQGSLEAAVRELGLPPEDKSFHPHLTLARLKFPATREIEAFLGRHRDLSLAPFEVREFHLYSSRLSPKGAEHRKEATYPLR
ncbi:MAG: RNA 2',3'-cyclic phosphodiesterase [bacterium]